MSLSANLFALLLCAAALDGGGRPEIHSEVVQEKLTLPELGKQLKALRDAQLEGIVATRDLRRQLALKDHWQNNEIEATRAKALAKQHEVCRAAKAIVTRLEADGAAVAFVEVLQQVHGDMSTAAARLDEKDVGPETERLQHDIAETLEEMFDAVTKTR
jgi:hypothetical protein